MSFALDVAESIFVLTLLATYGAAFLARWHSRQRAEGDLSGRTLNRWLVGLSAGTTANSGFIVTAAVGLGYNYGVQWLMLPISWLLGDLVFWHFFPERINAFGHRTQACTLSELIKSGMDGAVQKAVSVLVAILILICLSGYTAAQWLAGEKFLAGAFHLPNIAALALFALMIVSYSAIGGFRGSVYTDVFQSVIRILGTVIALWVVVTMALSSPDVFQANIAMAGEGFLVPFANGGLGGAVGFVGGFAAASIGFGLGQPQIVSRYLAGRSPEETRSAMWIYIGFVQFTWLAMTLFGILLRGVMPGIADPEMGLSTFFANNVNSVATGIIVADVFATIASTSNGLLIAMTQAVVHDLLPRRLQAIQHRAFGFITLLLGTITMSLSLLIQGSVVQMALSSVSLMGAGVAPAVMIKVMGWRHSAWSIMLTMLAGLGMSMLWVVSGLDQVMNEAAPGIAAGLLVNYLLMLAIRRNEHA